MNIVRFANMGKNRVIETAALYIVTVFMTVAVTIPPVFADNASRTDSLIGYVKVERRSVKLTVPNAHFDFRVGDSVPLFQQNKNYCVGVIPNKEGVKQLAAIRVSRRNSPVWVSESKNMVFGREITSCKAYLEFKSGKIIGIRGITNKNYIAVLKNNNQTVTLEIPRNKRGLSDLVRIRKKIVKAGSSRPRVISMSSKTNTASDTDREKGKTKTAGKQKEPEPAPKDSDRQTTSPLDKLIQKAKDVKDQFEQPDEIDDSQTPDDTPAETEPFLARENYFGFISANWHYILSLVFTLLLFIFYRYYRSHRSGRKRRPPPHRSRKKAPPKEKKKRDKPHKKKKIKTPEKPKTDKPKPAPKKKEPKEPEAPPPRTEAAAVTLPLKKRTEQQIQITPTEKKDTPIKSDFMIGRYHARTIQGRGTTGIVYKAWQGDLKRNVALKILKEGKHASMEAKLRFMREAQALARLRHPNIITVHEVGEIDGQPFFSMDFIDGTPLDKLIISTDLTLPQTVLLCREMALAVHYAHDNGIIHRDLKPGNIIVENNGDPIITDFGLARNLDNGMISMSGDIIGTPSYMSPEQAQGKTAEVDARTDVYSIGAVLYSMLTRKNPFSRPSLVETLTAVINEQPTPIRKLNSHVDRELAAICMKAMAKSKTNRYASAKKMADALDRYLAVSPSQRKWRNIKEALNKILKTKSKTTDNSGESSGNP